LVSPAEANSGYRRPALGEMVAATSGFWQAAQVFSSEGVSLRCVSCNETPAVAECE
jgi:hypothetical protein